MSRRELPDGLVLAPLWRRAAAWLVNGLAWTGLFACFVVLVGAGIAALARLDGDAKRITRMTDGLKQRADKGNSSRRVQGMIQVSSLAWRFRRRNHQGLGARAFGIRRVRRRDGGPITVLNWLIAVAASEAWGATSRVVTDPMSKRAKAGRSARREQMDAELARLKRERPRDPEAVDRAREALRSGFEIDLVRGCLPLLAWPAVLIALHIRAVVRSPLHQSPRDRLSGVVWVMDPARPDDR